MKVLILFGVLGLVTMSLASTYLHPRGCIYIMGRCYKECPVGTHAYAVGCSPIIPEPTCDEPNPVMTKATVCDYSSCYCDPPKVKDKASGNCMLLEECPKKEDSIKKEQTKKEGEEKEEVVAHSYN